MKVAALTLVLAGCFSKPGPPGMALDAPPIDACVPSVSAPGLTSTTSLTPTVMWPDGMQLQFGDVTTNIPMPTFLSLSGMNVLAQPQTAQCGTEDRVGVAVFPSFAVSNASQASLYTLNSLDRNVVGPAYSEYTVHWGRTFVCDGISSAASGNTIFSLFPDGRIVRNDTVTMDAATLHDSCDCTPGTTATGFLVTAYLAVQRDQFMAYSWSGATETTVPGPMADLNDEQGACVVEPGTNPGRLAIAWETPTTVPARTRLRSVGPLGSPMAALVFVYDMISGSSLAGGSFGGRTTMVMSRGNARMCPQLHAAATATWPPISIGPVGMALDVVNSTDQRVHVDTNQYAGPITVRATNGAVPAGLVISVKLPGTGLTTSRTDGVVWQREPDGRTFIWFRDGLVQGESITITPDC